LFCLAQACRGVRPALIMDCSAAALDPLRVPGSWRARPWVCHTPQPTPPVTDDEEEDEDDLPDRGSDGGNIDPDDDEGWSDEDDEDDEDTGWSSAGRGPGRALRR
jgi:hypothetical protein